MTVTPHTREFQHLASGDCFAFGDNYFLKLATPTVIEWSGAKANAVCLRDGEPQHFDLKDPVTYLPKARIETE